MQNMQAMMKQAQKLQKQMQDQQATLAATTFTGKSAQELVTAEFSGDKSMKSIIIKADVIDADDPETLQDMIVAAVNDALTQVDKETERTMGNLTRGLPF